MIFHLEEHMAYRVARSTGLAYRKVYPRGLQQVKLQDDYYINTLMHLYAFILFAVVFVSMFFLSIFR